MTKKRTFFIHFANQAEGGKRLSEEG